eukprot:tig00000849_g4760.t2
MLRRPQGAAALAAVALALQTAGALAQNAALDSLNGSSESTERALYWVGFAGMAFGVACFFGRWLWNGHRDYYVLNAFQVLVACMAYWGLSFLHGQVDMNGFHVNWIRYVDWVFSTPMILLCIASIGRYTWNQKIALVLADVTMIGIGFFAAIAPEPGRWGFFAFSCAIFVAIAAVLIKGSPRALQRLPRGGPRTGYKAMLALTLLTWTVYPIIFGVGPEGAGKLNRQGEAIAHTVLDLFAKVVFGFLYLYVAERRFRHHKRHRDPEYGRDAKYESAGGHGYADGHAQGARLGPDSTSSTQRSGEQKKKASPERKSSTDGSPKKKSGFMSWWRNRPAARKGEESPPAPPEVAPAPVPSATAAAVEAARAAGSGPMGPDGRRLQVGDHVYFRDESGESEVGRIVSFSEDGRKLRVRRFLRARRMARVQLSAAALAITREPRQFDRLLVRSNQLVLVDTAHIVGRCTVENAADVADLSAYLARDQNAWFYVDSYDVLTGRTARGDAPNASSHEDSTSDDDVTFEMEYEGAPLGGGVPPSPRAPSRPRDPPPPERSGFGPRGAEGGVRMQATRTPPEPNPLAYTEGMTPRQGRPSGTRSRPLRPRLGGPARGGPWAPPSRPLAPPAAAAGAARGALPRAGSVSGAAGGGPGGREETRSPERFESAAGRPGTPAFAAGAASGGPSSGYQRMTLRNPSREQDSRSPPNVSGAGGSYGRVGSPGGGWQDAGLAQSGGSGGGFGREQESRSPQLGGGGYQRPDQRPAGFAGREQESRSPQLGGGGGGAPQGRQQETRIPELGGATGAPSGASRGPWGQPARAPSQSGSAGPWGQPVRPPSRGPSERDAESTPQGSRFVQVAL